MTLIVQALLTFLLRCVLLLALWPGQQAWAHAPGGGPACARHGQPAADAPAVTPAPRQSRAGEAAAAASRGDHAAQGHGAAAARSPVDACPSHATPGLHPDCCQGGACGCRCAAPAVATAVYLATPVPAAHDPVVVLFDYHPSHLLPQPYRPPIA